MTTTVKPPVPPRVSIVTIPLAADGSGNMDDTTDKTLHGILMGAEVTDGTLNAGTLTVYDAQGAVIFTYTVGSGSVTFSQRPLADVLRCTISGAANNTTGTLTLYLYN